VAKHAPAPATEIQDVVELLEGLPLTGDELRDQSSVLLPAAQKDGRIGV